MTTTKEEVMAEAMKMMDITSDNLTMITLLSTVQEMIRTFRREHPGMLPAEADARLVITLNQLNTSKENLNKAGESLDKLLIDKLQSMQLPPHYRSIETSRQLITSETEKSIKLTFPSEGNCTAKAVWYPKDYIGPAQDQNRIIIRYYPDWTFQVHEVDPITGRRIGGSIPSNINADSFKEMVTSANESYGLALQTAGFQNALKISEKNSMGRNLKL